MFPCIFFLLYFFLLINKRCDFAVAFANVGSLLRTFSFFVYLLWVWRERRKMMFCFHVCLFLFHAGFASPERALSERVLFFYV